MAGTVITKLNQRNSCAEANSSPALSPEYKGPASIMTWPAAKPATANLLKSNLRCC